MPSEFGRVDMGFIVSLCRCSADERMGLGLEFGRHEDSVQFLCLPVNLTRWSSFLNPSS